MRKVLSKKTGEEILKKWEKMNSNQSIVDEKQRSAIIVQAQEDISLLSDLADQKLANSIRGQIGQKLSHSATYYVPSAVKSSTEILSETAAAIKKASSITDINRAVSQAKQFVNKQMLENINKLAKARKDKLISDALGNATLEILGAKKISDFQNAVKHAETAFHALGIPEHKNLETIRQLAQEKVVHLLMPIGQKISEFEGEVLRSNSKPQILLLATRCKNAVKESFIDHADKIKLYAKIDEISSKQIKLINIWNLIHFEIFPKSTDTNKIDIKKINSPINNNNDTPLHKAVLANDLQRVRILVNELKVPVNLSNRHGNTPLHCAIRTGNTGILRILLTAAKKEMDKDSFQGFLSGLVGFSRDHGNQKFLPEIQDTLRQFSSSLKPQATLPKEKQNTKTPSLDVKTGETKSVVDEIQEFLTTSLKLYENLLKSASSKKEVIKNTSTFKSVTREKLAKKGLQGEELNNQATSFNNQIEKLAREKLKSFDTQKASPTSNGLFGKADKTSKGTEPASEKTSSWAETSFLSCR